MNSDLMLLLVLVGPVLLAVLIDVAYKLMVRHRRYHTHCTLEEYAERHRACCYCTRYVATHCRITKKDIYCPRRKRNCPIFDNVFERDRIKDQVK